MRNWNNWFKSWVGVDLLWAIASGIVMGVVVTKAIIWLDRTLQKQRPANDLSERENFLAYHLNFF